MSTAEPRETTTIRGTRPRRRFFRALFLAVATAATVVAAKPRVADAQVVRPFAPRFTANQRGEIVLVANTILTCSTTGANGADCVAGRNGTGAHLNNNDFSAQYIDVDGDGSTFNSSSAAFTLPAGATVSWAGLYWGAYTTAGAGGTAAPDESQRGTVKLATPGGGYQAITASQLDVQDSSYQGFRDVTALVQAGGSGIYTVANVQAGLGANRDGGWALVIVLRDPSQALHNLTVFDGFALVDANTPSVSMPVSGFITPAFGPVHTELGFVSYEGDLNLTGDQARLNGTPLSDAVTPLTNFFNSGISRLGTRVTTKNPDYVNQLGFDAKIVDATGMLANGATGATIDVSTGGETYYPGVVTFATELFSPDLNGTLVKTVTDLNGGTLLPGDTIEYTMAATNTGQDGATDVILLDTIPASTTYVPNSMRVVAGANPGPRTDQPGDDQAAFDPAGNRIFMRVGVGANNVVGGQLAPNIGFAVKFRAVVDPNAPEGAVIANQAWVTYRGQTLPTNFLSLTDGNQTQVGDQPTTIIVTRPDMVVAKTHTGTFIQGGTGTYQLVVSNVGTFRTFAPVSVADTLPPSLVPTSAAGTGWACTVVGQVVSCSRNSILAINGSYPAIAVGVNISFTAPANVTNTATVSGGGESNLANDQGSDVTPIQGRPDLAMIKAHAAAFTVGGVGVYTLSVTNIGRGPTTAGITVADTLPNGLTYQSAGGTGWSCGAAGQVVTCTNPGPIAGGGTSAISLSVGVGAAAIPNTVNTATVKTAGDSDPSNDRALDPTAVTGVVDVSLKKSHAGVFTVGTPGVYTLAVTSAGTLPTTGPITLVDTLPSGLTFASATGAGWACTANGQLVTCTYANPLAPAQIASVALTVNVAPTAVPGVTNVAHVTTPGDAVPANNVSPDPTVVNGLVDVSIVKSHNAPFTVGSNADFLLTIHNVGSAASAGPLMVNDTLPAGLTYVTASGTNWSCGATGQLVTCSDPGPFVPNDSTVIHLTVHVGLAAVPSVSNTASITTLGDTVLAGNNVSTDANIPVGADFRLAVDKRASRSQVEVGDVVDYIVSVRTLGASPVPGVALNDLLPAGFSYQRGTARLNGRSIPDPASSGPQVSFAIGTVPPDTVITLLYRLRVGSGAHRGTYYNKAQAASISTSTVSNVASAAVEVVDGVFTDRGVIVGKVYAECECGPLGVQGSKELGIPGVRVYLEDGSSAVTDEEGKYDFYNVSPRLHVLHVDKSTLPAGAKLVITGNRNLGDPSSRLVDISKGELVKVDFVDGSHSADAMREIRDRRARGPVLSAMPGAPAVGGAPAPLPTPVPTPQTPAPAASVASPATNQTATAPGEGGGYHNLLPGGTLGEGNSQLPPTPLQEAIRLEVTGQPRKGTLSLTVPPSAQPADGNTLVPVSVRLLDSAGTLITARTVVTLEATGGRWQAQDLDSTTNGVQVALIGGEGLWLLAAPNTPDTVRVRATAGALAASQRIDFVPALRPLVGAGLIEGRLNLRSLSASALSPVSPDDGFEQQLTDVSFSSDDGNFTGGARGALLLKGKVKGSYLLTLAYDSERDPDHQLFRDIQPDEFYPVYGDAAVKEYDAQSSDRLYVRVDRGRSYVLYGDYSTSHASDARVLSAYDRTFTGAVTHIEGGRGTVDVYGSQTHGHQVVDEIPGRGISGPYALTHPDGLLNSERVEIITRDRNQPNIILSRVPQTRFADYTMEPFTGRLLFRMPVPSLDGNLNPVSIRVTYETEEAGDAFWSYGVDGRMRVVDRVELGATFARDDDPAGKQQLVGVNSTIRLAQGTYLLGEFAQTDNAGSEAADAERVELRHASARFEGRAWFTRSDLDFNNPSSTFTGGRSELGGRFTFQIDGKTRILGDALRSEDLQNDGSLSGAQLSVERQLGDRWRLEVGYRVGHQSDAPVDSLAVGATPNNTNAIRAKLTARVFDRASVFGEYEQDVSLTDQHRGAIGGEYLFAKRGRVYLRHEWITSFSGPYALNELQRLQNTVVGVDADYLKNNQVFSEYRARDAFSGREAEAAIGLRNQWPIRPGLVLNTSFERVVPLSLSGAVEGAAMPTEATAITGAVEYTANPLWKGTARIEWRTAPSGDNLLGSLGYARKLSRDWTFLGRSLVDELGPDQWRERTQLGVAYRQTNDDRWNMLARYEHHYDETPNPGFEDSRHSANVFSTLVNFQPDRRWTLSGRYAAKLASDQSDSLNSQTNAQLAMIRALYDLTPKWDVGVQSSVLLTDGFASHKYGVGVEIGRIIATNLRGAVGYNVFGFHDDDLSSAGYTNRGVYLDLSYKFDESLFAGLLKHPPPAPVGP